MAFVAGRVQAFMVTIMPHGMILWHQILIRQVSTIAGRSGGEEEGVEAS